MAAASERRLYEPAAAGALLCIGEGTTLYAGTLDRVTRHAHGAPVYLVGLTDEFQLELADGSRLMSRAALVPAGVPHAVDFGGGPVAVFYPEPSVAALCDLARLGSGWDSHGEIMTSRRGELSLFRELYENRGSLDFAGEALRHVVEFLRAGATSARLDPRIARTLGRLAADPADLTPVAALARAERLSVSHFLHLFRREVGVPYRRYRIWNRVRAATRMALSGCNLTEAAVGTGFTDSAHFARMNREVFGLCPSYILRKVKRVRLPHARAQAR